MKLNYAWCTDRGLVRDQNEDTCLCRTTPDAGLFLVADGIGGRARGEAASGMIRRSFRQWWEERVEPGTNLSAADLAEEIEDRLKAVNRQIILTEGLRTSGSTVVLLLLYRGRMVTFSSGDSRIYRARGLTGWQQLTVDDVYENALREGDAFDPKLAGKLTGAVGIQEDFRCSSSNEPLKRGDRFLLCSDGVYRFHPESLLKKRVSSLTADPEKLVQSIADEVLRNGAGDNYTMIYVRVAGL